MPWSLTLRFTQVHECHMGRKLTTIVYSQPVLKWIRLNINKIVTVYCHDFTAWSSDWSPPEASQPIAWQGTKICKNCQIDWYSLASEIFYIKSRILIFKYIQEAKILKLKLKTNINWLLISWITNHRSHIWVLFAMFVFPLLSWLMVTWVIRDFINGFY